MLIEFCLWIINTQGIYYRELFSGHDFKTQSFCTDYLRFFILGIQDLKMVIGEIAVWMFCIFHVFL